MPPPVLYKHTLQMKASQNCTGIRAASISPMPEWGQNTNTARIKFLNTVPCILANIRPHASGTADGGSTQGNGAHEVLKQASTHKPAHACVCERRSENQAQPFSKKAWARWGEKQLYQRVCSASVCVGGFAQEAPAAQPP
eukprot:1148243-Pelagomonas_calceolata.AAC.4